MFQVCVRSDTCHLQCVRLRFCADLCEVLSSFLLRYTKLTVRLLTCVRKSVVGVTQTFLNSFHCQSWCCYKQADNACCGAESFVIAYRITAAGKLTANWADWSNTILLVTTALRVFLYFVCRNVLFLLNIVSLKRKQKLVSVLAN